MATSETTTADVEPGVFGCRHWIDVHGDLPMACDLSPDEHKKNHAGYIIHATAWSSGARIGIGERSTGGDHSYEVSWVDTSEAPTRPAVFGTGGECRDVACGYVDRTVVHVDH